MWGGRPKGAASTEPAATPKRGRVGGVWARPVAQLPPRPLGGRACARPPADREGVVNTIVIFCYNRKIRFSLIPQGLIGFFVICVAVVSNSIKMERFSPLPPPALTSLPPAAPAVGGGQSPPGVWGTPRRVAVATSRPRGGIGASATATATE